MPKPRRWRKEFPYYKIQVFDKISQAWKDERKVFDTAAAAQAHIDSEIAPRLARIMVIERNQRYVLD